MKVATHTILLSSVSLAALGLSGCSTVNSTGSSASRAIVTPSLIYSPPIQQGNQLEQAAINQLRPGMSRSQVQYLLGTPMLVDTFHQDRWDYYYSMKVGGELLEQKHLILHFQGDQLVAIEGDLRPEPSADPIGPGKETVYDVPDYEANRGILDKVRDKFGSEERTSGDPSDEAPRMPTGREPPRGSF